MKRLFLIQLCFLLCYSIKQIPTKPDLVPNTDNKQAPLPPNILIIQDMPQYGLKGLDKWEEYVEAEEKKIKQLNLKFEEKKIKQTESSLDRIAYLSNRISLAQLNIK